MTIDCCQILKKAFCFLSRLFYATVSIAMKVIFISLFGSSKINNFYLKVIAKRSRILLATNENHYFRFRFAVFRNWLYFKHMKNLIFNNREHNAFETLAIISSCYLKKRGDCWLPGRISAQTIPSTQCELHSVWYKDLVM